MDRVCARMMTEVASINSAIGRTSLDHLDRDPEVTIPFLRLDLAEMAETAF